MVMPKFLDLFVNEIHKKRSRLKEKLEKGQVSTLDSEFKNLLIKNWHPLPERETTDASLVAVDGSRAVREYANGSRFYVVRAFGLSNTGQKSRALETEVFLSRGNEQSIRSYISQKTELVETKLALEAIPHLAGSKKLILIDGSLFGRMMHLLRDSPVEGDRALLLQYVDTYSRLLETCKSQNVLLLGVSKDSRADFVRALLLEQICQNELRSLSASLTPKEIRELKNCVEKIADNPAVSFGILKRLREKYGSILDGFEDILTEYVHSRPDFQLILNFASEPGYCTPVELAATKDFQRDLKIMAKNPESFVRRRFKKALVENRHREDEFLQYATDVINRLLKFPTVVSFHLLFDNRDTPLRMDVPSWALTSENQLSTLKENRFVKDEKGSLEELIGILKANYAGLLDYNVWLKRVDEEVKLHLKDVDTIYERVLEKELGLTLIHTRGYRRVKYP
jgi:hypothetical protein